jgi:hypothetical protein
MLPLFEQEFARSKMGTEEFIARHYIGHHTPAGNHFTAMAMKDAVVKWLEPKPSPYR